MSEDINRDPDIEWLDHVRPVGLVIAASLIKELGLAPTRQTAVDTAEVSEQIDVEGKGPALSDPWAFAQTILGWEARHVAGPPGQSDIPVSLVVPLPEHNTSLQPSWAVREFGAGASEWQLLVRVEEAGVDPDQRASQEGWEATPQQRFERLLRETGIFVGLMITDHTLRLTYAPRGETSGHLTFPIRPLATVAGRPMLGGLKLLLGAVRLFIEGDDRRLPALLSKSRETQAAVSTALAGQVLGALHELLRGFDVAEPDLVRDLATTQPSHVYEGLLTVLMRLVFVLYAEDRDLLPSRTDADARRAYETSYAVRGLYARLSEDAALHPDTMDERQGGWGQLLALFRLIYGGHSSGFIQARGGKLFDPEAFPFLEGRANEADASRVPSISDGCLLRIFEGLMTLRLRGGSRERLSYRTLDVEQIGSVYETVMGFTVEAATSRVLAIKAGKNNKTPVFVALDDLLAKKSKDRIKSLKDNAGRALTGAQANPVEEAKSVEDLSVALDNIVDERGSPKKRIAPAGTPILQPTGERRRTGSHYTPRSLTAPIVKHALEPAFARLGTDATPEQVLDLKVCDPAMGSGAFLVEACRALGERLVAAWARWPSSRPKIPADEDEELHARRLVAQRCLYGVDKNPRAVDLARLSLWLATLARDHEFTFLDHALKCGDSLVGLNVTQIAAANWDESKPGLPLFRQLVRGKVAKAMQGRAEIQNAPDDTMRAIQEARHRNLESEVSPIRMMGDAVVSAFFAADKAKAREKARADVESQISGMPPRWDLLEAAAARLRASEQGITPFHWQVEFPEVFARENGGFDAIVGNPPFLGGTRIATEISKPYVEYLKHTFTGAGDRADLVSYFFRQGFRLLRNQGVFGLIASNTISQGDTRKAGLKAIIDSDGRIVRAIRRYKWPGEAAVVVSIVHVKKGESDSYILDSEPVGTITCFLLSSGPNEDPKSLAENAGGAFEGMVPYSDGFMAVGNRPDSQAYLGSWVFPFARGKTVNTVSVAVPKDYIVFFKDKEVEQIDAPGLLEEVRNAVQADRGRRNDEVASSPWWLFWRSRMRLWHIIESRNSILVRTRVSPHHAVIRYSTPVVPDTSLVVFPFDDHARFATLQSRPHELWARFFSSTLEDRMRYTPSDCFRTFPFPVNLESAPALDTAGEAYHAFRAELMSGRNEGLTKTYNRFHARGENGADIARLRALHHEMDVAVLRAYGWDDLADRVAPEFIEQEADEGKTPKTRLDWSSDFKDEVLARLLALNATRAAEERAAGLVAADEGDDEEIEDEEGE